VHDLARTFRRYSYEETIRWIPSLTPEEIAVVERYYGRREEGLDGYEQRVRAYREERIQLPRRRFPETGGNPVEPLARVRALQHQRR
jgi:hypothetical protein